LDTSQGKLAPEPTAAALAGLPPTAALPAAAGAAAVETGLVLATPAAALRWAAGAGVVTAGALLPAGALPLEASSFAEEQAATRLTTQIPKKRALRAENCVAFDCFIRLSLA